MTLPHDPTQLSAVRNLPQWVRGVERALRTLDNRLASSSRPGVVINYAGTVLPGSLLEADGSVVNEDDYPRLFAAIGTDYNTGGETAGTFRLPNYTTPPEHGVWAITT